MAISFNLYFAAVYSVQRLFATLLYLRQVVGDRISGAELNRNRPTGDELLSDSM